MRIESSKLYPPQGMKATDHVPAESEFARDR